MYSWFSVACRRRLYFYALGSKYDYFAKALGWSAYYRRNDWLPEPVILATALCISDEVFNPITRAKMDLSKESFFYVVIGLNFLCLIISVLFFWLLEVRTN
jgi:hypothetical protein